MNGDLRVAYRASPEGPRDIVFVPTWFTNCEVFPELPSLQGWVEAMTSLGRLIFFDQPARECPIPSHRARCQPWSNGPTASPRCSTISGAAKRSSSQTTARSRQRRCSRQHIRPGHPRWSCWKATRIRWLNAQKEQPSRKIIAAYVAMWGTGEMAASLESGHAVERGDPGNVGTVRTPGGEPSNHRPHDASHSRNGRARGTSDSPRPDTRPPSHRRPHDPA